MVIFVFAAVGLAAGVAAGRGLAGGGAAGAVRRLGVAVVPVAGAGVGPVAVGLPIAPVMSGSGAHLIPAIQAGLGHAAGGPVAPVGCLVVFDLAARVFTLVPMVVVVVAPAGGPLVLEHWS